MATVAEPFEFVALGDVGRRYAEEYLIRLGDADEQGQLRLDGAARFLQDVATDDWTDTGVASSDVWVVRRTTMRLVEGARWPRYLDRVTITTWCGGSGAAWAWLRAWLKYIMSLSAADSAESITRTPSGIAF